MQKIEDLFVDYFGDKVVKLNTKFNKVAIQRIYCDIFVTKPKLSDIKINDKTGVLKIFGKKVLQWDRNHNYNKAEFLTYVNFLYLKAVEDILQARRWRCEHGIPD